MSINERRSHRDNEKHVSQIPALYLLQKLGFQLVTKRELDKQRRGKLGNVLLEDILREQLAKLNRIEHRGATYPFSEANIETAIERVRHHGSAGLVRTNEAVTDLLQLGTSLDQTIDVKAQKAQMASTAIPLSVELRARRLSALNAVRFCGTI